MYIGIGGAGNKIASLLDKESILVNISEAEMNKYPARQRILAVVHSPKGQRHGAKKIPSIGMEAFASIREELLEIIKANIIISSTGGGTGNGITTKILNTISDEELIDEDHKTSFILILPDGNKEPFEFVRNTVDFLSNPLSNAIDSGNTGNIFLVSNKNKFDARISEKDYNEKICESFRQFYSIPKKCETMEQIEGYIDIEDFLAYTGKPYFNYFATFNYDPGILLGDQLKHTKNPLLLDPCTPIEAMFLLEIPANGDSKVFYGILEHFEYLNLIPIYAVVRNSHIHHPQLTVSLLYSRKPQELIDDYIKLNEARTKAKIKKSLEQHVIVKDKKVNIEEETKKAAHDIGRGDEDIVAVLKRLGKL